jgi:hypothetical protein
MKAIVISILISCFIVVSAHATDLRPSLGTQMQHQSKLDKKNTAQSQARERRALQEQKKQKNIKNTKIEHKNSTPSLTIPPAPRINPIETNIQSQNTRIPYNPAQTYISSDSLVPGVDMTKIRNTWLEWTNQIRVGK